MYPDAEEFNEFSNELLAKRYLCSVRTIQRWRSKLKLNKCPGWGPGKLNLEKAREIRHLYENNSLTQSAIAKIYGVSQAAIGRIINNISYPEKNVGISGTSSCIVNYLVV